MTETRTGSYDDAPESPVATELRVPLLWGHGPDADHAVQVPPARRSGRGAPTGGRHRARPREAAASAPTMPATTRVHLVHTLRVGAVSALLVLLGFAGVLLLLAVWLP